MLTQHPQHRGVLNPNRQFAIGTVVQAVLAEEHSRGLWLNGMTETQREAIYRLVDADAAGRVSRSHLRTEVIRIARHAPRSGR